MITGDLDRALGTGAASAGTWRPCPAGPEAPATAASPGCYATSVPFLLTRDRAGDPATAAAGLAARLTGLDWVAAATVTGGGYLTVTVTAQALARLAVRITEAGPACARSGALTGRRLTAPRAAGLAAATWQQAHDQLTRHVTGRLAEAAGATVTWSDDPQRAAAGGRARPPGGAGPMAEAIAYAGADAVIFALCRLPPGAAAWPAPRDLAAHDLANPAYAVRYAHAHAASVLRQAADLGLDRGEAAGFQPGLLAHPCEQALLDVMSWLPERVAGAARRGQPRVAARHLEVLAAAWLSCHECCPAAWPGMAAGPGGSAVTAARLWLAAAARTSLAAGLRLLGVQPPDRL